MPNTKLRAPVDFAGLSVEGRSVEVGDDGAVQADHRDVATLRAHGFTDWADGPQIVGDIDTMTHAQLVEAAVARTRNEAGKLGTERLREHLRADVERRREPIDDDGAPSEAEMAAADARLKDEAAKGEVTAARIDTMTRPELFAFLRARNVAIGPATKTPGLRAAALAELQKTVV